MTSDLKPTRRTVLIAGAGAVTLAACGTSSGGPSSGATQTGTGTGGARSASTPVALAKLADVPVGACVAVTFPGGQPGIVARPTPESIVGLSAVCTHQGCTVAPQGKHLVCPCHGSVYNAFTGAVEQPVIDGQAPLPKVPVAIADGNVVTA